MQHTVSEEKVREPEYLSSEKTFQINAIVCLNYFMQRQQHGVSKVRLISYSELRERGIRYTRQHIDRLVAAGSFPAKVHIGPARIGWVESEVDAWLKAKADARNAAKNQAA